MNNEVLASFFQAHDKIDDNEKEGEDGHRV